MPGLPRRRAEGREFRDGSARARVGLPGQPDERLRRLPHAAVPEHGAARHVHRPLHPRASGEIEKSFTPSRAEKTEERGRVGSIESKRLSILYINFISVI